MAFKGLIAAAVSVALVTTPTLATAQATTSAAREIAPAAETVEGEELRGGWIIPLIALIAIILGLCVATDICGGENEPPTSP